jgi:hypothetical protein
MVEQLGIDKRVSWQTFRSTFTSLLTANNENIKVVHDLLRRLTCGRSEANPKAAIDKAPWCILLRGAQSGRRQNLREDARTES